MTSSIYTFTGRRVNPLDLRPEDICIEDIAHHLACCNRFAGACRVPISVAQHSVYAAQLCWDTPHALQALLHDAAEAYLGDVTKWLKMTPEFAAYREAEHRIQRTIYRHFGCAEEDATEVKSADRLLVRYEMWRSWGEGFTVAPNALQSEQPELAALYPDEISEEEKARIGHWVPWDWRRAEWSFLTTYRTLTRSSNRGTLNVLQHQQRLQGAGIGHPSGFDPDLAVGF